MAQLSGFAIAMIVSLSQLVAAEENASYKSVLMENLDECGSIPDSTVRVLIAPVASMDNLEEIVYVGALPDFPAATHYVAVLKANSFIEGVKAQSLVGIDENFRVYLSRDGNNIIYKQDFVRLTYLDVERSELPLRLNLRRNSELKYLIDWNNGPEVPKLPGGSCSLWGLLYLAK